MYSVLNYHNVAKLSYTGMVTIKVTSTGNAVCFKEELYNDIPNVTLWRVLRKRLLLKSNKLSIVQLVYVANVTNSPFTEQASITVELTEELVH
jgi:hypothetical protein